MTSARSEQNASCWRKSALPLPHIFSEFKSAISKIQSTNRFNRDGIRIEGNGTNLIDGNWIGVGLSGNSNFWNARGGIFIFQSHDNVIGGSDPDSRSVISGQNLGGIYILNLASSGNQILGNFIGTDVTGTIDRGNINNGILISDAPFTNAVPTDRFITTTATDLLGSSSEFSAVVAMATNAPIVDSDLDGMPDDPNSETGCENLVAAHFINLKLMNSGNDCSFPLRKCVSW